MNICDKRKFHAWNPVEIEKKPQRPPSHPLLRCESSFSYCKERNGSVLTDHSNSLFSLRRRRMHGPTNLPLAQSPSGICDFDLEGLGGSRRETSQLIPRQWRQQRSPPVHYFSMAYLWESQL